MLFLLTVLFWKAQPNPSSLEELFPIHAPLLICCGVGGRRLGSLVYTKEARRWDENERSNVYILV